MIEFSTKVLKFAEQGEKTGWMYIEIPKAKASKLKADNRKSFRIKGHIDGHAIQKTALLPMGEGNFILPFNASIRKATGKKAGDVVTVKVEVDESQLKISADLIRCLKDDPKAYAFFKKLPPSHQHYFSKWIEGAKTPATKTKRITMTLIAFESGQGYSEMMRANKNRR